MPFQPLNPLIGPESSSGALMPYFSSASNAAPNVSVPDNMDSIATTYNPEIQFLGQQSGNESEALALLEKLARSDPRYMELYVQLLAEKENAAEARKWYEEYNSNYYQREYESMKKAGMNPWLALQGGFGQTGTGFNSSAGTFTPGVYQTKSQEKIAQNNNLNDSILKGVQVAGAILVALIMAMA